MAYIRLTINKPLRGQEARLEELMRKLDTLSEGLPGFVESYLLRPHDNSGEIARIAIYENEAAAEGLANTQSWMALRSEIHLCTEPGHSDRAFFSI